MSSIDLDTVAETFLSIVDYGEYGLDEDEEYDDPYELAKLIEEIDGTDAEYVLDDLNVPDSAGRIEWWQNYAPVGSAEIDLLILQSLAVVEFNSFRCKECGEVGYSVEGSKYAESPEMNYGDIDTSSVYPREFSFYGAPYRPVLCEGCTQDILRKIA